MENIEYFELKYLEEIHDLFLQIRDKEKFLGINTLSNINSTDLMEFMENHIEISPFYNSDSETEEDYENLEYTNKYGE